MKKLLALLLIVGAFFAGRFIGKSDGPFVAHYYLKPPVSWETAYCSEPAVVDHDDGWHEGRGWSFEYLVIDGKRKIVSGQAEDCRKGPVRLPTKKAGSGMCSGLTGCVLHPDGTVDKLPPR